MVLIDTSIWIGLYRQRNSELGGLVWRFVAQNQAAICGQVYVEFISGFRKEKQREDYASDFQGFPFLETNFEACKIAAEILAHFPNLGSGDAMIGATAILHQVPLLTVDKDFRCLESWGLRLFLS